MNNNLKAIVGFVLGAISAGVAVYFYQDKRLSKKFEEELKAYTDSKKEDNKTSDNNITNETNSNDAETKGDDDMNKTNIPQDALDAAKRMQDGAKKAKEDRESKGMREKNKTNYSKLARGYASTDEAGEEKTNGSGNGGDKEMTLSEKIVKNQPYYISREEFLEMDMKDGYRGVDLFYNADTDTICNDDGEELDSAWESIGWSTLQDLYDGKGGDELYVRNDNFKEVYCISRNFML
jgi:hypothetical protein